MANRLTQDAVEKLALGNPNARLTQNAVESLTGPGIADARLTQVAVEVLARVASITPPIPAPTVPGYTPIAQAQTQGQAVAQLSERLSDPGNVYWSLPELRLYLAEALRTWQAYTSWYRQKLTVPIVAGTAWYDLPYTVSAPANSFNYNVTDGYLAQSILYHLLESQLVNNAWAGTDQFDLAKIQNAIQNRLNLFIAESGAVVSYFNQTAGLVPPASRPLIIPRVFDILRVAWQDGTTNVLTNLWKVSEWELNAYSQAWAQSTASPPSVYSQSVTPPVSLQIAPPPSAIGNLEILAIQTGVVTNLPAGPVLLGVPDDFTWAIKWGAMADLLSSDGQAKDAERAAYCEQRYREAIELLKVFPAVLQTQVNAVPVYAGSIFDLDAFLSGWENLAPGTPTYVGMAGRNLMALSPPPTAGTVITIDAVTNMPVPVLDSDFLQVPADVMDVILDYAQHLASFKMGGSEFMATDQQRKNFVVEAGNYNDRLRQLDFYNDAVRSPSLTEQAELPRIESPVITAYPLSK